MAKRRAPRAGGRKTARQVAASRRNIKKAQIASARKRKGRGKKIAKVVVAGTAVGLAGYAVHKNREKLIVAPLAEGNAVLQARRSGVKGKKALRAVRLKERSEHASRSTYRVREYQKVRNLVRTHRTTLKPGHKNNVLHKKGVALSTQKYIHTTYRKDVNARARHRLNRAKGRKATGFSYKSGKIRTTYRGRVVRLPI